MVGAEPYRKLRIKDCEIRLPTRRERESNAECGPCDQLPWRWPYPEAKQTAFFGYFDAVAAGVFPHVDSKYWHVSLNAKGFQVCSVTAHYLHWIGSSIRDMVGKVRVQRFREDAVCWFSSPFERSASNPLLPGKRKGKPLADWHWRFSGLGSCVYFVQRASDSLIKIGVSDSLPFRFDALLKEYKTPLKVLGVIPGFRSDEHRLHKQFANVNVKGEWFAPSPGLVAFVEANANKGNVEPRLLNDCAPCPLMMVSRKTATGGMNRA
jgi:hypothetical protein